MGKFSTFPLPEFRVSLRVKGHGLESGLEIKGHRDRSQGVPAITHIKITKYSHSLGSFLEHTQVKDIKG
jgi:hypothetical protein